VLLNPKITTGTNAIKHPIKSALSLVILLAALLSQIVYGQQKDGSYSEEEALRLSQAAIGQTLLDLEFTDTLGERVTLAHYAGKPILISLIFTSCHHVCPTLTRHLKTAVDAAREALGNDSFRVITIGFDTPNDTPDRMRDFARKQSINDPNWVFLSSSAENMTQLTDDVGFIYFTSPSGFDHITQLTIVDRKGVINTQVYGGAFELPWLVEPLKDLILNRPQSENDFFSRMVDKVNLFCTVYDPNSGRYHYDYSLFVQIGIGGLAILCIFAYLLVEIRRSRRNKQAG
jgi:protein SCO1/2